MRLSRGIAACLFPALAFSFLVPGALIAWLCCPCLGQSTKCADAPDAIKYACLQRESEGKRNWVLNSMKMGLDALQIGQPEYAARCFDEAISYIETIYANDQNAARARSLWREEGAKDFKGEPYERAMAYYYRGLIDLMQGDSDNARASFRGGSLQDAFAEEEQNRCDFALFVFLQGWCSRAIHDDVLEESAFEELRSLRPSFTMPAPNDNTLFLVELGKAPYKRTDGIGHDKLKLFRGKGFSEDRVLISISGNRYTAQPVESISWQAATRGARPIDYILNGKVVFKEETFDIGAAMSGTIPSLAGHAGSISPAVGDVGNALGLVGGLVGLVSTKVKAKADVRYWNNLPDAVHVLTAQLAAGDQAADLDFFNDKGEPIPELHQQVVFHVDADSRANLVWVRSRQAMSTEIER